MKKMVYLLVCTLALMEAKSQQCPQSLKFDTTACSGTISKVIDATVLKSRLCEDSITILFNAAGTPLAGDTNVYFHSGPEFRPFSGWQQAYTVGTFTANNGVGRMTSVGVNLWAIRIQPRTYYNYSVDSCLNGLWMVFRNFNGTKEAKNNGTDIFLYTVPATPTAQYGNVSGLKNSGANVTYLWSDANTSGVRTFTTGGTYTVTATGSGGCTASGSVSIKLGKPKISLGVDVVRCNSTVPVPLSVGSGYASYKWLNNAPSANATYSAAKAGSYWVAATDSAGCVSADTMTVTNSAVLGLNLEDSLSTCPGGSVTIRALPSVNNAGDSVVIIYDATKGQTGLVGASKVYMHSGPRFTSSPNWQLAYTIGNFTSDDGIGQMTSLGNNKWRIVINPVTYYRINPDSTINGIFIVFRNADGSQTGKDGTGQDILLNLSGAIPSSTFNGVTGSRKAIGGLSYQWSDNSTLDSLTVNSAGVFRVTVSDQNSCSQSDSIKVVVSSALTVSLGPDTNLCAASTITVQTAVPFNTYVWSTGASTRSIFVSARGTYSVTVTNGNGCTGTGTVFVDSCSRPVINCGTLKAKFGVQSINGLTVSFKDSTQASRVQSYSWSFGDGNTSAVKGNVSHTYSASGSYTVKLTVRDSCGGVSADSIRTTVDNSGCGTIRAKFRVQSISPGNTVTIIDSSQISRAKSYEWNFGDGITSPNKGNAVHTYSAPGSYLVKLTITDSCGGKSSDSLLVNVNVTGIASISNLTQLKVYPNPASEFFEINFEISQPENLIFSLTNSVGQRVWQRKENLSAGSHRLKVEARDWSGGLYLLHIENQEQYISTNILLTNQN